MAVAKLCDLVAVQSPLASSSSPNTATTIVAVAVGERREPSYVAAIDYNGILIDYLILPSMKSFRFDLHIHTHPFLR
jgi:hypothetical protein